MSRKETTKVVSYSERLLSPLSSQVTALCVRPSGHAAAPATELSTTRSESVLRAARISSKKPPTTPGITDAILHQGTSWLARERVRRWDHGSPPTAPHSANLHAR